MARIVHGKIKTKGNPDKLIAIGVLEKQLYREKTVMKGMFPPHKVHDPPDEYKFEDVNAIPLVMEDRSVEEKSDQKCTSQIGEINRHPINQQLCSTIGSFG